MKENTIPTTVVRLSVKYKQAVADLEMATANRHEPGGMALFLKAYHEKDKAQKLYATAASEMLQSGMGFDEAKGLAKEGLRPLIAGGRLR